MTILVNINDWNTKSLSLGESKVHNVEKINLVFENTVFQYNSGELRLKLPEIHFPAGFYNEIKDHFTEPVTHFFLESSILEVFKNIEAKYLNFASNETHYLPINMSVNYGKPYIRILYRKGLNPNIANTKTNNSIDVKELMMREFWAFPTFRFVITRTDKKIYLRCELTELKVTKIDN
jgi:hypothetical protein